LKRKESPGYAVDGAQLSCNVCACVVDWLLCHLQALQWLIQFI